MLKSAQHRTGRRGQDLFKDFEFDLICFSLLALIAFVFKLVNCWWCCCLFVLYKKNFRTSYNLPQICRCRPLLEPLQRENVKLQHCAEARQSKHVAETEGLANVKKAIDALLLLFTLAFVKIHALIADCCVERGVRSRSRPWGEVTRHHMHR